MGTRAAFWIGNPIDLDNREWLGCVAWDGFPENFDGFEFCNTEKEFRAAVSGIAEDREDFSHPENGWPFPWDDDVFLTDATYFFKDGQVYGCWYHHKVSTFKEMLNPKDDDTEENVPAHYKVPAPAKYNRNQPDSIMIVSVQTNEEKS